MNKWRLVNLGDLITHKKGFAFKSSSYVEEGILVVRVSDTTNTSIDVSTCKKVSTDIAIQYKNYELLENDIVIMTVGSWPENPKSVVGKVIKVPLAANNALLNQNAVRIRSCNLLNQSFLYYILKDRTFSGYIVNNAQGSANQASITLDDIFSFEFNLPPLPEQKAIASVLSSIDDKIDLLHRQNKTLEAMAETLFRQWFVEEADEGWGEGCLGDIIKLKYGKGLKGSDRTGNGYPVVGSSGIVDYHSEFLVEAPGIVIGRKGTLGHTIYLEENFYPIDTTYYIKSKIDSKKLFYELFLLKTINFQEMNTDSAVPGLNRNIALSTELIVPPESVINDFNELVSPQFSKLLQNKSQIRTLEKLRDTLQPKLMSGEVRVEMEASL